MPARQDDYYTRLGVLRSASAEEIRRAYYAAAQRLHPDKNQLAGETELFLEVQKAYEVLSNPQRRAQYDATLPPEPKAEAPIRWDVEYSRPSLVHLTEPQLVYVLLQAGPPRLADKPATVPLNLCLVIDRSTSMQGEKLDLAKAAATEIMSALRPGDVFSLIAFSDRAEVLVRSGLQGDIARLQTRVHGLQAGGSTEMYQGLSAGIGEVLRSLDENRINHLILLTDGHTYGDEQNCLKLAEQAAQQKIGISGFGIGGGWNDIFLDALASTTGSNSTYIAEPKQIQKLLVEKFNALTNTFAEDVTLEAKSSEGVVLSYAFRLQPDATPIALQDTLHLGPIHQDTDLSVLFEFLINPSAAEADVVALLDGALKVNVSGSRLPIPPIWIRFEREATNTARNDAPPPVILDALSRFTLYRLQERARQEADSKEYESATRHLKNLAARLLTQGEHDLAKTALIEAEQTARMQGLSNEGSKAIKYGTRSFLAQTAEKRE